VSAESEKPEIVSRLGNISFGLWFPIFRRLAGHVPPDWLARVAGATVERAVWAREHVREAILENYRRVLGPAADERALEEAAREMISRHSRLWIDLLRYSDRPDLDPSEILASRSGDGRLLETHREGKGSILLTAHVGNFELGGLFLRKLGLTVHAVYAPDPSPVVEAHRETARRTLGVNGIPVTTNPFGFLPILRALKENACVAMQGDRDVSGTGRRLPFFGETASFPVGPFKIAAISGAPLFPVFVLQEPDGRYRTVVHEPIPVANPRDPDEKDQALTAAMGCFVSVMERTIRENPTQWYLFTRFWNGTD
jgi:lauroyl/myristoyl acyltransferase